MGIRGIINPDDEQTNPYNYKARKLKVKSGKTSLKSVRDADGNYYLWEKSTKPLNAMSSVNLQDKLSDEIH